MPRRKKAKPVEEVKWYVLFGFNKNDDTKTGYFKAPSEIVDDINKASSFPTQNVLSVEGFGTPHQWLDFVNEDNGLNNGFQFHLVRKPAKQKL